MIHCLFIIMSDHFWYNVTFIVCFIKYSKNAVVGNIFSKTSYSIFQLSISLLNPYQFYRYLKACLKCANTQHRHLIYNLPCSREHRSINSLNRHRIFHVSMRSINQLWCMAQCTFIRVGCFFACSLLWISTQ